jgi:hypothetical protein
MGPGDCRRSSVGLFPIGARDGLALVAFVVFGAGIDLTCTILDANFYYYLFLGCKWGLARALLQRCLSFLHFSFSFLSLPRAFYRGGGQGGREDIERVLERAYEWGFAIAGGASLGVYPVVPVWYI